MCSFFALFMSQTSEPTRLDLLIQFLKQNSYSLVCRQLKGCIQNSQVSWQPVIMDRATAPSDQVSLLQPFYWRNISSGLRQQKCFAFYYGPSRPVDLDLAVSMQIWPSQSTKMVVGLRKLKACPLLWQVERAPISSLRYLRISFQLQGPNQSRTLARVKPVKDCVTRQLYSLIFVLPYILSRPGWVCCCSAYYSQLPLLTSLTQQHLLFQKATTSSPSWTWLSSILGNTSWLLQILSYQLLSKDGGLSMAILRLSCISFRFQRKSTLAWRIGSVCFTCTRWLGVFLERISLEVWTYFSTLRGESLPYPKLLRSLLVLYFLCSSSGRSSILGALIFFILSGVRHYSSYRNGLARPVRFLLSQVVQYCFRFGVIFSLLGLRVSLLFNSASSPDTYFLSEAGCDSLAILAYSSRLYYKIKHYSHQHGWRIKLQNDIIFAAGSEKLLALLGRFLGLTFYKSLGYPRWASAIGVGCRR